MGKYIMGAIAASLLLFPSCKKDTTSTSTTTCSSVLYGNSAPASLYDSASAFGVINPASATLTGTATFMGTNYENQAAFNTSDNCYYVFKTHMGGNTSPGPLYKISTSGTITSLTTTGTSQYSSPVYDRANNKLYCIKDNQLAEITIAGSTFSTTGLVTPIHYFSNAGCVTVDNNTGDVYYLTANDTITYYIEKYHPGSSASVSVASGSFSAGTTVWGVQGLRFNKNDNMLYATRGAYAAPTFDFIKINPASGTISTVATITGCINPEFYSACIDPCSNRYIISTPRTPAAPTIAVLYQLSMTGTVIHCDTTASLLQGMDVN